MPIPVNEARLRETVAAQEHAIHSLLIENGQLRQELDAYRIKQAMIDMDIQHQRRRAAAIDAESVER